MRYVQINSFPNGSTGNIMLKKHRELLAAGVDSYAFWGRAREGESDREWRFATGAEVRLDGMQTRLDGKAGFHSKQATERLLARLDELQPDVVHLHNVHGYYVNVEMLFDWLARHEDVQVRWTLHDCWAFTGHCAYFTYVKCAQWQTHCAHLNKCPQLDTYPKTFASSESCRWCFDHKKAAFTNISEDRMTLITPSHWLESLVKQSFLSKYPIEVIHNTIDTEVFKPTPSDFRERYGLEDKFIVLGVASPWSKRKGLDDFIRLAAELDDRFAIVLVGLSKKQIKEIPKKVIGIERTESREELAAIYTAADLYLQPSTEETYGMTVAEAAACGTPVLVVDGTACMEASANANRRVISPDLGDLRITVVRARGGVPLRND